MLIFIFLIADDPRVNTHICIDCRAHVVICLRSVLSGECIVLLLVMMLMMRMMMIMMMATKMAKLWLLRWQ